VFSSIGLPETNALLMRAVTEWTVSLPIMLDNSTTRKAVKHAWKILLPLQWALCCVMVVALASVWMVPSALRELMPCILAGDDEMMARAMGLMVWSQMWNAITMTGNTSWKCTLKSQAETSAACGRASLCAEQHTALRDVTMWMGSMKGFVVDNPEPEPKDQDDIMCQRAPEEFSAELREQHENQEKFGRKRIRRVACQRPLMPLVSGMMSCRHG